MGQSYSNRKFCPPVGVIHIAIRKSCSPALFTGTLCHSGSHPASSVDCVTFVVCDIDVVDTFYFECRGGGGDGCCGGDKLGVDALGTICFDCAVCLAYQRCITTGKYGEFPRLLPYSLREGNSLFPPS